MCVTKNPKMHKCMHNVCFVLIVRRLKLLSIITLNHAWKRYYLAYSTAHYHNKSSCKVSAWLVKDFLRKGEKSKKTHKLYIIYAYLSMQQSAPSFIRCTLPKQSFNKQSEISASSLTDFLSKAGKKCKKCIIMLTNPSLYNLSEKLVLIVK